MKFLWATLTYLAMGLVLGWGILSVMKGNPWPLIVGLAAYSLLFAKAGCLPGKSH